MKKYELFLFDLDDTLLNFKESERLSFYLCLQSLGIKNGLDDIFKKYKIENQRLWQLFEQAQTTKDHLKVERFRKTFEAFNIDTDPQIASTRYLDTLPETVVLMDHAKEICQWLSEHGEIGIITNGISDIQSKRIKKSQLAPYISFVSVSEDCGHAKPDVRFFEYSIKMAKKFSKNSTIIIGDRLEADILGANNFGIDGCWFNPEQKPKVAGLHPTFEIQHLSEIRKVMSS